MKLSEPLKMEFEPATIEHLGLSLYVTLPPVIGELVSNSWDADARNVWVKLPMGPITPESEFSVRDDGFGMDESTVRRGYLRVGRNCRKDLGRETSPGGRPLMGRKGIGKLSAFGVAREVRVRTVAGGIALCFRLNYDRMKEARNRDYEAEFVEELSGPTEEPNGTEVTVSRLNRTKAIDTGPVRRELARRFLVFGQDFKVRVGDEEIGPKDRRLRDQCVKSWDVKDLPGGGSIDPSLGWTIRGWMGWLDTPSSTERGIDIFVRKKAAELSSTFHLESAHSLYPRAYVVGEVEADFLDEGDVDSISTGRNSIQWESERGQKLQEWGLPALRWVLEEWNTERRNEREGRIINVGRFDEWLRTRTDREQRVAKRLVKLIVDDDRIEPASAGPLLEIVKTNIEFEAFRDLVDDIEESGATLESILRLFHDWRVVEARAHLELSDGRLEVMEKLTRFMREGADEVREVQPLFRENGWLLDPDWGSIEAEVRYSRMLREHFPEAATLAEPDRRIDLLAFDANGDFHVVELKRPEITENRDHLEQIERYVDWLRTQIGTDDRAASAVRGLLVVGHLSKDAAIVRKRERLRASADIRVDTYAGLLNRATKRYGEVEQRLKSLAPEYARDARKSRRKS
jgi:hypothetical protein